MADDEFDAIVSGRLRPEQIPADWVGEPIELGRVWRWSDPKDPGNSVTFFAADPGSEDEILGQPTVVVRQGGRVIGSDGRPIDD
ncbi:MAG: hypothetical protein JNK11_02890 [Alphaproteobacteria bacterium]|nr:hypothetical protein [Alphaproteobacteria bacterium]